MSTANNYLDITLLGKEYRVACPPEEREALLAAVAFVDEKMHDIAEKTKSNVSERIAVMAALNIAHEHLALQKGELPAASEATTGLDFGLVQRRIASMEAELDAVLDAQEQLI